MSLIRAILFSGLLLLLIPACGGGDSSGEDLQPGTDTAGDLIGVDSGVDGGLDAVIPEDGIMEDLNPQELVQDTAEDTGPVDLSKVSSVEFTMTGDLVLVDGGGDHLAFPDVTGTADGRLMLVYRQGSAHVSMDGRLMKVFGSADGRDWGEPQVLFDQENMDDRDPSVQTLADGRILVNYFQYRGKPRPDGTIYLHEIFLGSSSDNGETFGPFVQVSGGSMDVEDAHLNQDKIWVDGTENPVEVSASSGPVIESNGRLLLPAYGGAALNLANLAGAPRSYLTLLISEDQGQTWTTTLVDQKDKTNVWLMEPAVLDLGNNELIMHIRTATGSSPSSAGNLLQLKSTDGGETWSDYRDLGFVGHAAELHLLNNGVLLSAFRWINQSFTNETVSFIYSLDRGETWSQVSMLEACGASECGYPGIIELPTGEVMFVFYSAGGESIKAKIFETTLVTEGDR